MADKPDNDIKGITTERQASSVRESFRVPIEDKSIQAVFNNKSYQVTDISPWGINFICKEKIFIVSQTIDNCKLIMPGGVIENLVARVIHFSSEGKGTWQNGVQWVDISDESLKKISEEVSNLKKKLLAEQKPGADQKA